MAPWSLLGLVPSTRPQWAGRVAPSRGPDSVPPGHPPLVCGGPLAPACPVRQSAVGPECSPFGHWAHAELTASTGVVFSCPLVSPDPPFCQGWGTGGPEMGRPRVPHRVLTRHGRAAATRSVPGPRPVCVCGPCQRAPSLCRLMTLEAGSPAFADILGKSFCFLRFSS